MLNEYIIEVVDLKSSVVSAIVVEAASKNKAKKFIKEYVLAQNEKFGYQKLKQISARPKEL